MIRHYNYNMDDRHPFRLSEIVDDIESHGSEWSITRHGRPVAVIIRADKYESLIESLNILSDDDTMAALTEAAEDLAAATQNANDVYDIFDVEGNNATASFLLNEHHAAVGTEDKEGYIDNCERCGFAAGWVQTTSLGGDEKGHSTTATSAEVQAWIAAYVAMGDTPPVRVAGIAGGVGTSVVATVLGGLDLGQEHDDADVIVARNDYRSARALVEEAPKGAVVILCEPQRALTQRDFEEVLGRPVVWIDTDPAVARADDAGLLDSRLGRVAKLQEVLRRGLARVGTENNLTARESERSSTFTP